MKNEIRFAAVAGILDKENNKVLLSQRDQPGFPEIHGKWQFPGGTIEFGEHPEETAIRETKEEIGIDIKLLSNRPFINSFVYADSIQGIIFIYPAKIVSGQIDISNNPKTKDVKWFEIDNLDFQACLLEVKNFIKELQTF